MATINPSTRLKFLQSQLQYYASHLSLADLKAGGIMAFSVAISGVTADKMVWGGLPQLFSKITVGWVGLFFSLGAMFCAFFAVRPRYKSCAPPHGIFGWVGVADNAGSKNNRRKSHAQRIKSAMVDQVLDGMADTIEDLAVVISKKYWWIKGATWGLVPATVAHISFWIISNP